MNLSEQLCPLPETKTENTPTQLCLKKTLQALRCPVSLTAN